MRAFKTSNGWTVRKCAKPCDDPTSFWTGQWFAFERPGQSGKANWRTMAGYIGLDAWAQVVGHYRRIRGLPAAEKRALANRLQRARDQV